MTLNEKIVKYAKQKHNKKVGAGECWDLLQKALKSAKAYTSRDYDPQLSDPNYTWGTPVSLAELQPGDLIQFSNYSYSLDTIDADGGGDYEYGSRSHHSAIVAKVEDYGVVYVYEQNANGVRKVKYNKLYFMSWEEDAGGVTTTVEVSGQFWFYRPEAVVEE